ncbi:MAG: hypothetical protein AAF152_11475 [Cyanobacteria bacterium P01_A01_bin.114]
MLRNDLAKMFASPRLAAIAPALACPVAIALLYQGTALSRPALADDSSVSLPVPATLAQVQSVMLDLQQIPVDMTPSQTELNTGVAITENSMSETTFTSPSLWWQEDQSSLLVGSEQLISGWVAYRREGADALHHIDLDLDRNLWTSLNYIQQYTLISHFGQTAKSYGYQLRVFTGEILAGAYVCNFNPTVEAASADTGNKGLDSAEVGQVEISQTANDISCTVSLDYLGRGSIRGRGTNPFGQP